MIHLTCQFKKLSYCSRGNTWISLWPLDRKCFTRTCLTICKYANIKPIDSWLHQSFSIFKYLLLRRISTEASIKIKCFEACFCLYINWKLIWNVNNYWRFHIFLFLTYWSHSCIYSNLSLHIFQLIVKLLSFENLLLIFLINLGHMSIELGDLSCCCGKIGFQLVGFTCYFLSSL